LKMVTFPRQRLGMISSGIMGAIILRSPSQSLEMLSEALHSELDFFS
jgi:hypothetical protein